MTFHEPVLVKEVLDYLDLKPGGLYLDVTFGGGGHTKAILTEQPDCSVIAMDWDALALEQNGYPLQEQFPGRLKLIWGSFSNLEKHLRKEGITKVDGILADFGTSQYQLTQRAGFSFYKDTPLDMRMSPSFQKITAQEIVNRATEKKLYDIFKSLGEEPHARKIARLIVQERQKKPIKTTKHLSTLIERVMPWKKKGIHPATRSFQALRIYINKELENIRSFLPAALRTLHPGGRLLCISFHSLEDRIVKQFFKLHTIQPPIIEIITTKIITATSEEIKKNPSSRSAKLRVAELKKYNSK